MTIRARDLMFVIVTAAAGCGSAFAIMVHPQTGHIVECRENLFDGIPNTLGRCIEAYQQAGYELRGKR